MIATIAEIRTAEGRVAGIGIFPRGDKLSGLELYRAAYAGDGAEMTGVQVMDEFETMSGPVLMAATTSLGEVYDVALTMAFARSAELEIGSGWPPVVIGIDLLIPVGLSSVTRAQSGDVEAIVHGGSTQSIAIVITSRDVNAAALRHAAESARSLLRAPKSIAVAISTATPPAGGGRWSLELDDAVRKAVTEALDPERPTPSST
ncbi:MAG: hypothetical protein IPF53_14845 [Blastocatellia bacterium]|jgi:hypothetical protein|nr:hypothetical protein [Blastocatellia bacterium]